MTGRRRTAQADQAVVVPELIQGPWTSLVVLTYTAHLSFFETHLLRQLSQVALRLVLADGAELESALQNAAASGLRLGQVNRTYLAAPIRHDRAAHAKAVLLTTATEGRLLVGSGNLGQEGYAAPGELWHVFAYKDEHTEHIAEFAAVRSLIDTAARRGLLDPPATEFLDQVWNESPWIPDHDPGGATVRHNHDVALIDQLQDAAASITGPVRTLTVHAPFHDPAAAALGALITRLQPERVRVLLTRNTSVDPAALQAVLRRLGTRAQLHEITVTGDSATYIHAKWVHLAGEHDEVLLSGSANLSRSALLTTSATGNVEIGVLQRGSPGSFDHLYAPLTVTAVDDLSVLGLKLRPTPEPPAPPTAAVLMWSQLDRRRLTLVFDRDIDETGLRITGPDGSEINALSRTRDGNAVTLDLSAADAELLAGGGPITVSLAAGDDEAPPGKASWPYQVDRLRERLRSAGRNRMLAKTGPLPETDKDLYELLAQLEQTLITDPLSAWKVVHPSVPIPAGDPDGVPITWDDIDWDRLKRSPRYAAYHYASRARINPTDIEIILASISGQLNPDEQGDGGEGAEESADAELGRESTEVAADPELAEAQEAGERGADEEPLRRQMSVSTRTRMAFGRFVARYTNALANAGFIDMLGPTLTVHNAVIMHHLLSRLAERDGVDPVKAARAYLAIWQLLWGTEQTPGLIDELTADERAAADLVMRQGRLRSLALQAIASVSFDESVWQELGTELRTEARHLCTNPTFALDAALLKDAAPLPGRAGQLLDDLLTVASHFRDDEVIEFALHPFGLSASAAHWETRRVRVQAADGRPGHEADVWVLEVRDAVPGLTAQSAVAALARLVLATRMTGENLEYWRIRFSGTHDVCFWDARARSGICSVGGDEIELTRLDVPRPDWWSRIDDIRNAIGRTFAA